MSGETAGGTLGNLYITYAWNSSTKYSTPIATLPIKETRNAMKPTRTRKIRRPERVYMNPKLTAINFEMA
jgi:hypothetical protein